MKKRNAVPKSGTPIGEIIHKELRDPEYRRDFLRHYVRVEIASFIKHVRLSRGLTQKQLAARAGVPQSQIARLESVQDVRIPSLDLLIKVLSALESRVELVLLPTFRSRKGARELVLT